MMEGCSPVGGRTSMEKDVKRNYKDTVFRMIFKEAEHALALYNALNGTDYRDVSSLEYNTLENAIYMNMKNDLSFLITSEMNLYEQQSTFTPNMPLRDLFHVADALQAYTKDKSVYSARQIYIPSPCFVVFYNGTRQIPERMEQKLSDSYEYFRAEPALELKVTLLNINPGMNEELKKKCPVLKEYMIYVERVRTYAQTMELATAVEYAVEECIRENILRDFLLRQKAEVVKMSIYEYDEERELQIIRADERELGREEERKKTKEAERRREEAEQQREEAYKSIILLSREVGRTKEDTINHLIEKCHMNREDAKSRIACYWSCQ